MAAVWTSDIAYVLDDVVQNVALLVCGPQARRCELARLFTLATALPALLALIYWLGQLGRALLRWLMAGQSRAFVSVASAAANDLRKRGGASRFPPTPHTLRTLTSTTSCACTVCYKPVTRGGLFCELCGAVVHGPCSRSLRDDCRTLMAPGGPRGAWAHDWRPLGCTLYAVEPAFVQELAAPGGDGPPQADGAASSSACCIYCSEPCEVGLIAVEPVWSCSWCHAVCHVQCHVGLHPGLFRPATKARLQLHVAALEEPQLADRRAAVGPSGSGLSGAAGLLRPLELEGINGDDAGRWPTSPLGLQSSDSALRQQVEEDHALAPAQRSSGSSSGSRGGKGKRAGRASADGGPVAAAAQTTAPPANRHATRRTAAGTATDGEAVLNDGAPQRSNESSNNTSQLSPTANGAGPGVAHATTAGGRLKAGAGAIPKPPGRASGSPNGRMPQTPSPLWPLPDSEPEPAVAQSFDEFKTVDADVCRLGPAARLMVPPWCIHVRGRPSVHGPASPAGSPSSQLQRGLAVAAAAVKWRRRARTSNGGGGGGGGGGGMGGAVAVAPAAAKANHAGPPSHGAAAPGTAARSKGHGWWRRGGHDRGHHRWADHWVAPSSLPPDVRPLLVFVNLKSGPQLGRTLLLLLLQLLHPLQVVELPREDPVAALRFFSDVPRLRVLVMGGDGTVGWVLQVLDTLAAELGPTWVAPPVAVLPMGTGNDLARCLGWGGTASGRLSRGLVTCLHEVGGSVAHPVPLDRWAVAFRPPVDVGRGAAHGGGGPISRLLTSRTARRQDAGSGSGRADAVTSTKVLNNYMGIGIDAKVALEFHQTRSAMPHLFTSQLGNKVWYTGLGAPDLLRRSCAALSRKLTLTCDGVRVPVPEDAQGLVIINIGCHMGGVFLWETGLPAPPIQLGPDADPEAVARAAALTANKRMALADGLLEVVAFGGVAHMGRLAVGLARAQRLAQCSQLSITTHTSLPMQVDGEPWLQEACRLSVSFKNQVLMLRCVGGGPAQRVVAAIQDALEASQAGGIITVAQKTALAREVGKRLDAVLP